MLSAQARISGTYITVSIHDTRRLIDVTSYLLAFRLYLPFCIIHLERIGHTEHGNLTFVGIERDDWPFSIHGLQEHGRKLHFIFVQGTLLQRFKQALPLSTLVGRFWETQSDPSPSCLESGTETSDLA